MTNLIKLPLTLAIVLTATTAIAATSTTITQKGKEFSERRITIAVGDTVTFLNDDGTTHNIHSNTDGAAFDLGAQAPGETLEYTCNTAGKVKVRCAIHPKMKLDVTVE